MEVPDVIIYGIPEGFDEPKIAASLDLIVGVDMTGKVKYLEQQQLAIIYKTDKEVDWLNLSLVLRGKKVVVAPFSPFIVKLSNIPIDLYAEEKLTQKLAENIRSTSILGAFLDTQQQAAYVHSRTSEDKNPLVKKEVIEIGVRLIMHAGIRRD